MKLLAEAFAKRKTYGSITSNIPRRQLEQSAKQIVDAAQKFAETEGQGGEDNFVAFEAMNLAHYEYRILLGFIDKELKHRGHDEHALARTRGDFADMHDDINRDDPDHAWGHGPVVQEAYDTAPIHPYWGGPPTPDNTEINPYFTTDFYQALSGGGGGGGGGTDSAASMAGIEAEEEMEDDDFSIDDRKDSFADFLQGSGCGGEEHEDAIPLKGGWKLYRLDGEGDNGEE